MNQGRYGRALAEAALTTRHPQVRDSNAMERFFYRHRWMFSGREASWVWAAVSVSGWQSVAEQVVAERREMRGEPADPRRFGKQASAVGLGIRALLLPDYFMRRAFQR